MALVKKAKFAKFDETVDLAIRLGVNPKHADQMVRGVVSTKIAFSTQHSAVSFSTWRLASAAAADAIENGARADWRALRRCSGYEDER